MIASQEEGALEEPSILDNLTDTGDAQRPPAKRTFLGALRTPPWLVRVMVESSFIVLSILLALAVDQWRGNREHRRVAQQALRVFEVEIEQNLKRLEDAIPYHAGLQNVVAQIAGEPQRATELRSVMEGAEPTTLLNTAWQTALATGALSYMDVSTVAALSLTYSSQDRFRETSRLADPRLRLASGAMDQAVMQQALGYLTELVGEEQNLMGVYVEALKTIRSLRGDAPVDTAAADSVAAAAP